MPRYLILDGSFDNGKAAGQEIDLPADVAALHANKLKLLAPAVAPKHETVAEIVDQAVHDALQKAGVAVD